ncbi:hypothetical protein EPO34_01095 [Patescibacteria group bacterium]|nr:MAG: hypothetical protein EPO34_01095 [Patescibacteria group bacterium]
MQDTIKRWIPVIVLVVLVVGSRFLPDGPTLADQYDDMSLQDIIEKEWELAGKATGSYAVTFDDAIRASLPMDDGRWQDRIAFYHSVGLLKDIAGRTDAESAKKLQEAFAYEWSDIAEPYDEIFMLGLDADHVLVTDPEADVLDGNEMYVETLDQLAKLSDSAFAPKDIEERWAGEEGPVTVSFKVAGTSHTFSPAYLDDWLDLGATLDAANATLPADGSRFWMFVDGNTAIIAFLTAAQHEAIRTKRGIEFVR